MTTLTPDALAILQRALRDEAADCVKGACDDFDYRIRSVLERIAHRLTLPTPAGDSRGCELGKDIDGSECRSICKASIGGGECSWRDCPQTRDGEPAKSGRHCPRDFICVVHGSRQWNLDKTGHGYHVRAEAMTDALAILQKALRDEAQAYRASLDKEPDWHARDYAQWSATLCDNIADRLTLPTPAGETPRDESEAPRHIQLMLAALRATDELEDPIERATRLYTVAVSNSPLPVVTKTVMTDEKARKLKLREDDEDVPRCRACEAIYTDDASRAAVARKCIDPLTCPLRDPPSPPTAPSIADLKPGLYSLHILEDGAGAIYQDYTRGPLKSWPASSERGKT